MTDKQKRWTLNADVGEGCDDALVMPYLDCANVACGAHAGDEQVMQNTLALAKQYYVIVGAHPGYPDKANFGRFSLDMSLPELAATLDAQIRLLIDLATKQAVNVAYVKPHGALNHDMLKKPEIFSLICKVVASIDTSLALMVPTNANHEEQQSVAAKQSLSIWWEVFADRAYEPSGLLRPRKYDDAVHASPSMIVNQLKHIQHHAEIIAIDGSVLDVSQAQTICVHGDHHPSITAVQTWAKQS